MSTETITSDVRKQITEWLTDTGTCFLLGAGCSVCAGKPLISKLTKEVLKDADEKLLEQFNALRPISDRPATIEDLLNYFVRYKDILSTITNYDEHKITIDEIDGWLTMIKKKIVSEVIDDWQPSPCHKRFLRRLCNQRGPRDIFSLNYDTLLEASLDELRLPYADGFRGANRAWFDSETFHEKGTVAYRIFKLHGSVNWTRDADGHVRRGRNDNGYAAEEPIVVYPSEQKYLQTQYGVYETLLGLFRERLRIASVNNYLVVLGYSFNDEHINEVICDSIRKRDSNLTVVAFVGPESDRAKQDDRLGELSNRCDSRFNAFIGNGETGKFIGHAVDQNEAQSILDTELWKFENLVDFIAGEET